MADQPAGERTEQPTQKRLEKAREEGQLAQSSEAPSALMVAVLLVVLAMGGPGLMRWLVDQMQQGMSLRLEGGMEVGSVSSLLARKGAQSMQAMLPFLLSAVAVSVVSSLLVGGWAFSPRALQWKLSRLSPAAGLKNLVSVKSLVHLLACLVKLAVMLAIVYFFARGRLQEIMALRWATPWALIAATGRLTFGLVGRIAIGLLVVGVLDVLYQKWRHRRELRMTVQEVKEERRQYEVSPQVKSRIRTIQIEMVRRRMLQEVPKADVVVTNPTHVAVALRYDAKSMEAPQVVAKGAELLSEKIKEIARAHGVPIVERPELARTLYATVRVGQSVPEVLFVAVAEVLAMIYRLRNKRLGSQA